MRRKHLYFYLLFYISMLLYDSVTAGDLKSITLQIDTMLASLRTEGYMLSMNDTGIIITGAAPRGVFYGIQTLRQLFPAEIEKKQLVQGVAWTVPVVTIQDTGRFLWRGSLLDCCRHFFTINDVKRYIDLLAYYKMNRFHWHLTEDQGWRIEIKRYPKLTEVGAWRKEADGSTYGGFYTQNEVKEVIAYAAQRGILTIPEIEMPGHALAALASYPTLSCTGGPFSVPCTWGVFDDVYCAGNDSVFVFLQNVLSEIIDLFPSRYIHIGGDECPKTRWNACAKCKARMASLNLTDANQLQSWFINKIQAFLKAKIRDIVGWEEIAGGGLALGAIIESWKGTSAGIAAANAGYDVIMSPKSHCYFDYTYTAISLSTAYSFEPVPSTLPADKIHHILGTEGNLWTERIENQDKLDYQAYPRLCALSEVGWTASGMKKWVDFSVRMSRHYTRQSNMGVKNYRDPSIPADTSKRQALVIPLPSKVQLGTGNNTLDPATIIWVTDSTRFAGEYFAASVAAATGYTLQVKPITGTCIAFKQHATHTKGTAPLICLLHTGNLLTISSSEDLAINNADLLNLKGQIVVRGEKESVREYRFNISSLPKGVYIIALCSNKGRELCYLCTISE